MGLRDADQLATFEGRVTTIRLAEVAVRPLIGRYDLAHLKAFHRHLFQDVYGWAGELRTVDIAKPGTQFGHWRHLAAYLTDALAQARADALVGADQERVVKVR